MHPRPARALRARATAIALALSVHGVFVMLLLLERNNAPEARLRAAPAETKGIWIRLHEAAAPETPPETASGAPTRAGPVPPTTGRVRSSRAAVPASPSTAITLPPSDPAPVASPGIKGAPYWFDETSRIAKEAAARADADQSFGGPVRAMREPCRPRKSSFEWKDKPVPADPPPEHNALAPPPGSVMVGGTRVGVAGFSIPLGGKPEPNKHLFDDMMAGRTPASSVPDPNFCD